jgi:hypothetical protein
MPVGKLFLSIGYAFVWDREKPYFVCDEAVNAVNGDDFFWYLKSVFPRAEL